MKKLQSALAKVQHFQGEIWGGNLTPVECLALVDAGAIQCRRGKAEDDFWQMQLESLKSKVDQGVCRSSGFYFSIKAQSPLSSHLFPAKHVASFDA